MSQRLSIEEFGKALLGTGDLDPIYTMLVRAEDRGLMSYTQIKTWCMAYWCCYHAGVASMITDSCSGSDGHESIWTALAHIVNNVGRRWPRGTERRHFRGANGNALITGLRKYRTAADFINYVFDQEADPHVRDSFCGGHPCLDFRCVAARIQTHVGLGPWIAFKIADMSERVLHYPVDFSQCEMGIYDSPAKGAELAWEAWEVIQEGTEPVSKARKLKYALERLGEVFAGVEAPPDRDRLLNVQEFETILCKWKSHLSGHYPVGKDTHEIREGLAGYGDLASSLVLCLPEA